MNPCGTRRPDGLIPTPEPRAHPLTTTDGVRLATLQYGRPGAAIAVVFGHGFTGSQHNRRVVAFAQDLATDGLAVYTADFRGHGDSGGFSTLGDREVHDLDSLVALAREQHERVVSIGASMGAFVALRHAGLGGDVDAVIAISSPADGREPRLRRARVLDLLVRTAQGRRLLVRYGTRVDPVRVPVAAAPLDLAGEIAPIPVAIVHGGRDHYVPLDDAYALYDRLGEPRRLVVLPGFGHGEAGFTAEFAVMVESLITDLLATGRSR
jgi:pimeloyl-ACP methyl ester carboxylesterase